MTAPYEPTEAEIYAKAAEIRRKKPRDPEPSTPGFPVCRDEPVVHRAADVLPGVWLPPPSALDVGVTFGSAD